MAFAKSGSVISLWSGFPCFSLTSLQYSALCLCPRTRSISVLSPYAALSSFLVLQRGVNFNITRRLLIVRVTFCSLRQSSGPIVRYSSCSCERENSGVIPHHSFTQYQFPGKRQFCFRNVSFLFIVNTF